MVQMHHMLLHEISSKYDLKITEEDKMLSPVYIGATAKTLLSQLNDEELGMTLKHINFNHNGRYVTNPEILITELKEIKQRGYCVTCGERIPGALCISAPIKNYTYPATLNILGLENRLKPRLNKFIEELQISTRHISEEIAGTF